MQEFSVQIVSNIDQLKQYKDKWNFCLSKTNPPHADIEDYSNYLYMNSSFSMRMLVISDKDEIVLFAPFILSSTNKTYSIGERKLFSLPVKSLQLFGGKFIGKVNQFHIRCIFQFLIKQDDFHILPLGEVALKSSLHDSLREGLQSMPWRVGKVGHKNSIHWLTDFPETFDEYMDSFSSKTRSTLKRKIRKFHHQLNGDFEVITESNQVDKFLELGEAISKTTYQWNVGQRLNNDAATRENFVRAAEKGTLRCYLLYADGKPCAFMRGFLVNQIYQYDTPGFNPDYMKFSAGTVLLLNAMEDLISNTDCNTFDYGQGGDMTGYKKTFGNRYYETTVLEISSKSSIYSMFLLYLEAILSRVKKVGHIILTDKLKYSLKVFLRKYDL
jgi:hypothetical protein